MSRASWLRPLVFGPLPVFALALLLRLVVLHSQPRQLQSDEIDYDALGWSLASTGSYSIDGHPTAYRAPGYPFLVAGVYSVCGRNPSAVRHLQAVLDSSVVTLLYLLTRRRGRRMAKRAAWIWALYPPAILFSNQLFSETLYVLLLLGFMLCLQDRTEVGKPPSWVSGLLLGLAVLVKPTTLLVIVLLPLVTRGLVPPAVTTVTILCGLLPAGIWVTRNAVVMGAPILAANTGTNLLIGNGPKATGGYSAIAPSANLNTRGEVEADRAASEAAMRFIWADPKRTTLLAVKKIALLLSSEAELVVGFWSRPEEQLRFRERYQRVPIWAHLLVSLPYAILVLLGLIGLVSEPWDLARSIFIALSLSIVATTIVFFGSSRFHFPMMPFMVVFGVEFLETPWRTLASMGRTKRGCLIAACGLLLAVWSTEVLIMTR
jgi:4-amino-4-deoxy-L-arabinose transferase-like glycosyltransferase